MHLHVYSAIDVRPAHVPLRSERAGWEPDDVFTDAASAVEWLASATMELCGKPNMNLSDEIPLWTRLLEEGESIHTGARDTTLLVENFEDCACGNEQAGHVSPMRRSRRR